LRKDSAIKGEFIMRKFINNLYQEVCTYLKLNLQETTIIEYLMDFMESGYMSTKYIDDEKYYWISYDKLLEDLPILNIGKRMLAKKLARLEQKNVLKIIVLNGNKTYVRFNPLFLSGDLLDNFTADMPETENYQDCQTDDNTVTAVTGGDVKNVLGGGTKFTPIVKLNRKKIILNIEECAREEIFSKFKLLQLILEEFKHMIPPATFSCLVKDDLKIEDITDREVVLSTKYSVIADEYINSLKAAFRKAMEKFV